MPVLKRTKEQKESDRKLFEAVDPGSEDYKDFWGIAKRRYITGDKAKHTPGPDLDFWEQAMAQKPLSESGYLMKSRVLPESIDSDSRNYYEIKPEKLQRGKVLLQFLTSKIGKPVDTGQGRTIHPHMELVAPNRYAMPYFPGLGATPESIRNPKSYGGTHDPLSRYGASLGKDDQGEYLAYHDKYDFNYGLINRRIPNKFGIYGRIGFRKVPKITEEEADRGFDRLPENLRKSDYEQKVDSIRLRKLGYLLKLRK